MAKNIIRKKRKKKFRRFVRIVKKVNRSINKKISRREIIKKAKLSLNFFIIKKFKVINFDFRTKQKMSLFLNYHPILKFILRKTFKNIRMFKILKKKNKYFLNNTGFKNSRYLKFEKDSRHLDMRFERDVIIKRIKFKNKYIQM
jgi:hypothetical protein